MTDFMTLLTCNAPNTIATKTFIKQSDGTVIKKGYNAGMLFKHSEEPIKSLRDIEKLFLKIENIPNTFAIRGKSKEDAAEVVHRRIHGELAAFDAALHRWTILDIDKIICPDFIITVEDKIKWIVQQLPDVFHGADCVCKLSSSYGLDKKSNSFSGHLAFMLDRPCSDVELKAYFKGYNSPVDVALFSPVQPHYTAKPIFVDMDDPVEKRVFYIKGENAKIVTLPKIEIESQKARGSRELISLDGLTEGNRQEALQLIGQFYPKEGGRNKFCGAVAGTLARRGLDDDTIAEFVYTLALSCSDEEADQRQRNAYDIGKALDNGQNVQGVPTLMNEFDVSKENIDLFLELLGVGAPDLLKLIEPLSNTSSVKEIKEVVSVLASIDETEQSLYLDMIKDKTGKSKGALSNMLKSTVKEFKNNNLEDPSYNLVLALLSKEYKNGQYLMLLKDGCYWKYNGRYWEIVHDNLIRQQLILLAQTEAKDISNLEKYVSDALKLLKGIVFRNDDPLYFKDSPPNAFNTMNCEIWFNKDGCGIAVKPHSPESGFRWCMNARYNPDAVANQFVEFEKGIFRDNDAPAQCANLMREILAYACMEWKKIATIVILFGEGGNGKTRYGVLLDKLLGGQFIHSGDVTSIERSQFQRAGLVNKKVFLDDDVKKGVVLSDGTLKKISEEKTQTGEHKHKDPFDFTLRLVPILMTNHKIQVNDKSNGMKRRLIPVPFKREFLPSEQVLNLVENIWEAESSGVLNLIIEAGLNLMQRKRFDPPLECVELRNELLNLESPLTDYVSKMFNKDEAAHMNLSEFLNGYCTYHNLPTNIGGGFRDSIEEHLYRMGFEIKNHSNVKVMRGVALKC
jgi:P4 family phage/plasmid primase-like protien